MSDTTVQDLDCPNCGNTFQVIPRAANWSGDIRFEVKCPHCKYKYRWKYFRTGVRYPDQPPVPLFRLNNGRDVALEDYECSRQQAEAFAGSFRQAWRRIPSVAVQVLSNYWSAKGDTPHVWLLEDRADWGGRGWAASSPDGKSLYFVSGVATRIPKEHLELFVAHEMGHVLFIASGEETHLHKRHEPMGEFRCEWLVWQLMMAWGFDQQAAEEWMERNFDEAESATLPREHPLSDEEYQGNNAKRRRQVERDLPAKTFPPDLIQLLKD